MSMVANKKKRINSQRKMPITATKLAKIFGNGKTYRLISIIFVVVLLFAIYFFIRDFLLTSLTVNDSTTYREYFWRYGAILLSLISSFLFVILLFMLFIKSKLLEKIIPKKYYPGELDKIEPNIDKLKGYFGEESFIYKEIIPPKKLKKGLLKTRRHFFKTFFYVFLFGTFLYVFLFAKTYKEMVFLNKFKNFTCEIKADIVRYGKYKQITITKDSIFIDRYTFITDDTVKILWQDTSARYCRNKFTMDTIFGMLVEYHDEKGAIIKPDTIIAGSRTKDTTIIKLDTTAIIIGTAIPATYILSITSAKDTLKIIDRGDDSLTIVGKRYLCKNNIAFEKEEKKSYFFNEQDSLVLVEELMEKKIKKDTILNLLPKVDIRMLYDENNNVISDTAKGIKIKLNENRDTKYILHGAHKKMKADYEDIQNAFSFGINLFGMLTNLFLLIFFGLLNSKTDVFENERNAEGYSWLKLGSMAIFILICLVDAMTTISKGGDHVVDIPSLHFAMETIIAIVSVIAVFGVWGSMNSAYINFQRWFKLVVFIYAAAQIFAVFLESTDHTTEVIAIVMLVVASLGKIAIMYKVLHLVATERLSWFFLIEANEQRTNSYDAFVLLFEDENTSSSLQEQMKWKQQVMKKCKNI